MIHALKVHIILFPVSKDIQEQPNKITELATFVKEKLYMHSAYEVNSVLLKK